MPISDRSLCLPLSAPIRYFFILIITLTRIYIYSYFKIINKLVKILIQFFKEISLGTLANRYVTIRERVSPAPGTHTYSVYTIIL